MKNVCLSVLFLFICLTGFSQTADSDFREKTKSLIAITSGPQFDVMIQPLVNMVPEKNRKDFKSEIKTKMDGLYDQLAEVYMESYTEAEIDAILAFYASPIGKKMLSETPKITEKSMKIGQEWGMQLQPLIAKYSG